LRMVVAADARLMDAARVHKAKTSAKHMVEAADARLRDAPRVHGTGARASAKHTNKTKMQEEVMHGSRRALGKTGRKPKTLHMIPWTPMIVQLPVGTCKRARLHKGRHTRLLERHPPLYPRRDHTMTA
jgi:hypothetical protein